jgi:predicted  nucleic acid-binding Zn ribbon protein
MGDSVKPLSDTELEWLRQMSGLHATDVHAMDVARLIATIDQQKLNAEIDGRTLAELYAERNDLRRVLTGQQRLIEAQRHKLSVARENVVHLIAHDLVAADVQLIARGLLTVLDAKEPA